MLMSAQDVDVEQRQVPMLDELVRPGEDESILAHSATFDPRDMRRKLSAPILSDEKITKARKYDGDGSSSEKDAEREMMRKASDMRKYADFEYVSLFLTLTSNFQLVVAAVW
jgi:hypothetical protein